MFALTVALSVASTTRPFYEGVWPVSGATPQRLAASLRIGAARRGPNSTARSSPRAPAPSDPIE